MPVGDVHSDARGSGARFNDGKVPLELLDAGVLALAVNTRPSSDTWSDSAEGWLAKWQRGGNALHLLNAARVVSNLQCFWPDYRVGHLSFGGIAWDECARVFDFGRHKYSEWNWAKGMAWSIPFGCAMRHLQHMYDRELIDDDSGLTHVGHFLCNIMMLVTYETVYPEGDDRPGPLIEATRRMNIMVTTCNTPTCAGIATTSTLGVGIKESESPRS